MKIEDAINILESTKLFALSTNPDGTGVSIQPIRGRVQEAINISIDALRNMSNKNTIESGDK